MKNNNVPEIRFKGFTDAWVQRKLGEIADITSGCMGDSLLSDGEFQLTRIETISEGFVDESKVGFTNNQPNEAYKLNKWDILYSNINSLPHIGKVAIYKGNQPLYHGINLLRLVIYKGNSPIFMYFQLNTEGKRNWAKSHANQAVSQASINQTLLVQQQIMVCNLEEQKKIGKFLTVLDTLITLHQRKLEKLRELKKGYLQLMFPQAGERVPKVRFGGFEEEWEEIRLGDIGKVLTGNTPPTFEKENWSDDKTDYVWITPTDINTFMTDDSEKRLTHIGWKKARTLPAYSVLITSIASIGKNTINIIPAAFNQQINAIIPNKNDAYFILSAMEKNTRRFSELAGQTSLAIINKTEFEKFTLPIPTITEQITVGKIFFSIDSQITALSTKIERLKELKKAYLQKMFI